MRSRSSADRRSRRARAPAMAAASSGGGAGGGDGARAGDEERAGDGERDGADGTPGKLVDSDDIDSCIGGVGDELGHVSGAGEDTGADEGAGADGGAPTTIARTNAPSLTACARCVSGSGSSARAS